MFSRKGSKSKQKDEEGWSRHVRWALVPQSVCSRASYIKHKTHDSQGAGQHLGLAVHTHPTREGLWCKSWTSAFICLHRVHVCVVSVFREWIQFSQCNWKGADQSDWLRTWGIRTDGPAGSHTSGFHNGIKSFLKCHHLELREAPRGPLNASSSHRRFIFFPACGESAVLHQMSL